MTHSRSPNLALRTLMGEADWNGPALVGALQRIAAEAGFSVGYDRSTVGHWLTGTRPRSPAPQLLQEAFTRRLCRPVSFAELGLDVPGESLGPVGEELPEELLPPGERLERLRALQGGLDLGPSLARTPYRLHLAASRRPTRRAARPRHRAAADLSHLPPGRERSPERVGLAHVRAVRDVTLYGSRHYDAYGGAAARSLLMAYLHDKVKPWLSWPASDRIHRELLSATSQLVRVIGRTYTDDNRHGIAQQYYDLAHQLATEAACPIGQAMALREQSAQAGALGHHAYATELARAATALLPGESPPGVHAFALAQEAVACAGLRQADEARRLLGLAERMTQESAGDESMERYPVSAFLFQSAQVHRLLGAGDAAVSFLRASMRARPRGEHRTIGLILLQIARLELDRGKVQAARETYSLVLDRHNTHGSPAITHQAAQLDNRLRRVLQRPSAR